MIWYKFHIGDYLTHTVHLADAEDLAYRRLLDLYYMSEKEIPLDTESVARKIRLDLDITESVLGEFFEKTEKGYFNHRCHVEIAPKTNPKKIQIQNINTSSKFDEFWSSWPSSKRKVAKSAVLSKWKKLGLDRIAESIISNVNVLKESDQWMTGYEPAPLTYINQRRWEDETTAAPSRRVL